MDTHDNSKYNADMMYDVDFYCRVVMTDLQDYMLIPTAGTTTYVYSDV